tara:strand:+ start:1065 stop:1682 length:618 start_codon:yes stop_codon:yes gene_type:complete
MDWDIIGWFEVGAAVAAVMGGIFYTIHKKHKNHKKRKLDNFWKVHTIIHESLTELRVRTNCARTQIVQFHNGEYFMDGVSMRKFSLTHESINKGVSSEADKLQNLLISRFLSLVDLLMEDTPSIIFTDDVEDETWKSFLLSGNVEAVVALPLRHKGDITGYVMSQWCSLEKLMEEDSEQIAKECVYARNLLQINLAQQLRGKEGL